MNPKKKIFVTREIPLAGIKKLKDQGYRVIIHRGKNPLSKKELEKNVKQIDALLCILTDKIDEKIIEAAGSRLKIIANYAVGFDNIDMEVCYFDVSRNEKLEQEYKITYEPLESLLKKSDFVSIHAPLSLTTRHLIGLKQLKMMKKTAYLINTSRGAIIDEGALARALKNKWIQGAALDVFEFEPKLVSGITGLDNVVVTPHMASATKETRNKMSEMAADNIIAALSGQQPPNLIH